MIDRKSRYRATPTLVVTDAQGETHELLDLRAIPTTTGQYSITPTASDRLDLLAARYYRDPLKFWRICDASDHLVQPGEPIVIPPNT